MLLLLFLILAVAEDVRKMKISNRLIVSGLVLGLAFRLFGEGITGMLHFLLNISIPVILLFLLYHMHVIGAGDIKLISVVSSFFSWNQTAALVMVAFFTAAVFGLLKKIFLIFTAGHPWNSRTTIHFSSFILIGYLTVVWRCIVG